jgi:hypothetical protein
VVTIDLAELGVGGGVPPIEITVEAPVDVPPVIPPPIDVPLTGEQR